jgi:deoxyadenosine/deoxycytidine kinase
MLEKLGYDCFMVFINTTLDVALERNANRERVLPDKVVKDYWTDCQQNLGKFQSMFGASNMLIVDNSKYQEFPKQVKKAANRFVKKPIQNPIARQWIKKELELRKS